MTDESPKQSLIGRQKWTDNLLLLKQIAALDIANASDSKIAEKLKLPNRDVVRRIKKTNEYKSVLDTLTDQAVLPVVAHIRKQLGTLADECIRVLKEKLADNSLDAVKLVFQGTGVTEHEKAAAQADTTINVVLPQGVKVEKEFKANG